MNNGTSSSENVRSFCAFCGKPILPNAIFCSYCGKSQVPDASGQNMNLSVGTDIKAVKVKVSKPVKKENVFLVMEVVFALLALLIMILTLFIKFKSNVADVVFASGLKKETVTLDLNSYRLLLGGLILATVFIVATIVVLIMHHKVIGKFGFAVIIIICVSASFLAYFYLLNVNKLNENRQYFKMLQVMDNRKAKKGFVSYDVHTDE